jgi:hypothetical protein
MSIRNYLPVYRTLALLDPVIPGLIRTLGVPTDIGGISQEAEFTIYWIYEDREYPDYWIVLTYTRYAMTNTKFSGSSTTMRKSTSRSAT